MKKLLFIFLIVSACSSPRGSYLHLYVAPETNSDTSNHASAIFPFINPTTPLVSDSVVDFLHRDVQRYNKLKDDTLETGQQRFTTARYFENPIEMDTAYTTYLIDRKTNSMDSLQLQSTRPNPEIHTPLFESPSDLPRDTIVEQARKYTLADSVDDNLLQSISVEEYAALQQQNRVFKDSITLLIEELQHATAQVVVSENNSIERKPPTSQETIPSKERQPLQQQRVQQGDTTRLLKSQLKAAKGGSESNTTIAVVPVPLAKRTKKDPDTNTDAVQAHLVNQNDSLLVLLNELTKQQSQIQLLFQLPIVEKSDTTTPDSLPVVYPDTLLAKPNANLDTTLSQMQRNIALVESYVAASDSLRLLVNRIVALQGEVNEDAANEQLPKSTDTKGPEVGQGLGSKINQLDTLRFTAFYDAGRVVPRDETLLLSQVKAAIASNNLLYITLAGYADRSGSSAGNRRLTNKRLDHLLGALSPFISPDKIYTQNFSDSLSSLPADPAERRVVLELFFQQ